MTSSNPRPGKEDRDLAVLLIYAAVALILAEFLFIPLRTTRLFSAQLVALAPGRIAAAGTVPPDVLADAPWWGVLVQHAWWAAGSLVVWVAIPALMLRRSRGSLPFRVTIPFTWRTWAPYLALLVAMAPLLAFASTQDAFLSTYPLLKPWHTAHWSWVVLLLYWSMYATILGCTEFFFRGVLLFALEPRLGINAVFVSILPYCLIHVHKPILEAMGSIVAGGVLGVLALRTRSIAGGIMLHAIVAVSMDALALFRSSAFPVRFLP